MRTIPVVRLYRPCAVCFVVLFALLAGCGRESTGFALPEGSADQGRESFVSLGCIQCHSVMGDAALGEQESSARMRVVLGGPSSRVQTYGNLVTSIINPSHYLKRGDPAVTSSPKGTSPMPNLNEEMSVAQLVDLVTYLKAYYKVWTPPTSYSPL